MIAKSRLNRAATWPAVMDNLDAEGWSLGTYYQAAGRSLGGQTPLFAPEVPTTPLVWPACDVIMCG